MYGEKNSCKACASDRKKKCYFTSKKRDVGVIAWTLEREHFLPPPPLPPPSASPFLYQLARSSRNAISDWFITLLPLQRLQPFHFQSTELIYIINPNDDTKFEYN